MDQAYCTFHFYGDLVDLLSPDQRQMPIVYRLNGVAAGANGTDAIAPAKVAVKHPIEALGVPHPEVEQIVVAGHSVDFTYAVQPGDEVHVYPLGCLPGEPPPLPLRPPVPRPVRFILDTHLGQLAAYLRLFGFDALYRNDFDDAALAECAAAEPRVLLTRDRGLLKRKRVVYGHCVRAHTPTTQIVDILRRYGLSGEIRLWGRCLRCNGLLTPVAKAEVLDQLEPKTKLYYEEFQRCAGCGQVYWHGSHFERMQGFIARVLAALQEGRPNIEINCAVEGSGEAAREAD